MIAIDNLFPAFLKIWGLSGFDTIAIIKELQSIKVDTHATRVYLLENKGFIVAELIHVVFVLL